MPRSYNPQRILPSWYYRLHTLTITRNREIQLYDFDEDLSELEEPSDNESNCCECDCGKPGGECRCECECGESMDDSESERSYDGSDADYYYELREQREERKRELRGMRREDEQTKGELREFEGGREEEVQEALKYLEETFQRGDDPPSLDFSLVIRAGKTFYLYSVDYVDWCYDRELYGTRYVEFYTLDDEEGGDNNDGKKQQQQLGEGDKARQAKIGGHVYFNVFANCNFAGFTPPQRASLTAHLLKSYDGEYEFEVQFISNDYIIITVPREVVCMERGDGGDTVMELPLERYRGTIELAPERFQFVGIRSDHEKREAKVAGI